MAGPILNVKIFTKSLAHTLRAISVITFPPAFILLLIQGIASRRVNPAIGILPLFFSALFSLFLLYNEKQCGCQDSGLTGTPVHLVFDLMNAIGLLVCLILAWVFMPRGWNEEMIMFGTYCTNFLIANFGVHTYFIIRELREAVNPSGSYPTSCPHCRSGTFTITIGGGRRRDYTPLLGGEGRSDGYRDNYHEEGGIGGDAVSVSGEDVV